MAYKGKFKPKHPEKYIGDPNNIIYRSLWEFKVMRILDLHADVLRWGSEELSIPYLSPVDKRIHRYFPDFFVEKRSPDGTIERVIIEVKPAKETRPPVKPKKVTRNTTKRLIKEATTYEINAAKWRAAEKFCEEHGLAFKILTEHELGITYGNSTRENFFRQTSTDGWW